MCWDEPGERMWAEDMWLTTNCILWILHSVAIMWWHTMCTNGTSALRGDITWFTNYIWANFPYRNRHVAEKVGFLFPFHRLKTGLGKMINLA